MNTVLTTSLALGAALSVGLLRIPPSTALSTNALDQDTLQHAGQVRLYRLHLPPTYDQRSRPIPLLIALHGGGGSGQQFENQSGLSEKADREGFAVVYPDGQVNPGVLKLRTWNAGHCCGQRATTQQTDDVGFIRALISKLTRTYRLDPRRVYATGHSNGAMLCYRLACELPDKIAAIATNAGTMQVKTACQPSRVLPILHMHSKQDRNVPYDGGVGSRSLNGQWNPSVDSSLMVFARLARCRAAKPTVQPANGYTLYKWKACERGADLHYYLTDDGGHSWPGGQKSVRRFGDPPSAALTANDVLWAFVSQYTLP
ncbi:PHB depolymerase family esterase [Fibrella sp. WM1]|uniref:extracellular catalytic domain type 1 short-chain-length polyhydroxyalkanoate depolymerase n=1 Tax=Fibrella musci TaxID=3242485 RepID=UPI00352187FD